MKRDKWKLDGDTLRYQPTRCERFFHRAHDRAMLGYGSAQAFRDSYPRDPFCYLATGVVMGACSALAFLAGLGSRLCR